MSYDLVIFDCDGTLVDSEYMHNRVISEMLVARHPRYTVDYTMKTFAAMGMTAVVRMIEEDTGEALPPDFIDDYVGRVTASIGRWMRPVEGVHEVLAGLRGRYESCVASNGEYANVTAQLAAAKLDAFFPEGAVFTASMVGAPKPAPDLFLFAAEKYGADPARTLVIEDGVPGVHAARAAGMTVVGFTGAYDVDRDAHAAILRGAGAHHVTERFADIVPLAGL